MIRRQQSQLPAPPMRNIALPRYFATKTKVADYLRPRDETRKYPARVTFVPHDSMAEGRTSNAQRACARVDSVFKATIPPTGRHLNPLRERLTTTFRSPKQAAKVEHRSTGKNVAERDPSSYLHKPGASTRSALHVASQKRQALLFKTPIKVAIFTSYGPFSTIPGTA